MSAVKCRAPDTLASKPRQTGVPMPSLIGMPAKRSLLCGKGCKVGGSNLRTHTCLAEMWPEVFEMQHILFDAVCLELRSMPYNDFQQLGLASHRPEDVALAALELLYLNPKHLQYRKLHHANTIAASSQLFIQSSESKKATTTKASGQMCGAHFQRLRCLMV